MMDKIQNAFQPVGGINAASTEAAVALYEAGLVCMVPVSHARVAESCKLLENILRSVNIALVNVRRVAGLASPQADTA